METDMLREYLSRPVIVQFALHMVASPDHEFEEGQLMSFDSTGILLEQSDAMLLYIPMGCIRSMRIKPAPSFWQRLTGAS